MKISKRDYSHLKGAVVNIKANDGTVYEAVVAGCVYGVGITIEGDSFFRLCLNASSHMAEGNNYNGAFASMVAKIKRGEIALSLPDDVLRWRKCTTNLWTTAACAFT